MHSLFLTEGLLKSSSASCRQRERQIALRSSWLISQISSPFSIIHFLHSDCLPFCHQATKKWSTEEAISVPHTHIHNYSYICTDSYSWQTTTTKQSFRIAVISFFLTFYISPIESSPRGEAEILSAFSHRIKAAEKFSHLHLYYTLNCWLWRAAQVSQIASSGRVYWLQVMVMMISSIPPA